MHHHIIIIVVQCRFVPEAAMDRHADGDEAAFFTDEEIAKFAEHLSDQGLRIYIGQSCSSSISLHPALKDLVSGELDLKDATTSASIVPMASDLAAVREEEERRELERCRLNGAHYVTTKSLPYVHDENRYHQMMMNSANDDCREQQWEQPKKQQHTYHEGNNCSEWNESVESCTNICNQSIEKEIDSNTNEHQVDDSNDVNDEEVHKTLSDYSSEDDERGNNRVEETEKQAEEQTNDQTGTLVLKQTSEASRKRSSSYSHINAGIVAQREKIRDICNNRQRSSKNKQQVRRGNYFKEVRQKCGDELSTEEEEEEQSYEKQAEHPKQQQEVDEKSESGGSSEGFLDTEDEQSDDLIEFETQTEQLPIARKRKSSLLATSEAIGSSIAKAATDGGDDSQWISRTTKRRSKLKRTTKRVSLDTASSNKPSATKQTSTATQHRNRGRQRTVGFGAAPKAINKRKTQLSLLQMLKKK